MKLDAVVTINRMFGSGGRIVAEKLAEKLDVKFYDKQLIYLLAKDSGLSEEAFEKENKPISSVLYNIGLGMYSLGDPLLIYQEYSNQDLIFKAQVDVITELAKKPCVIVGRCSDYILRNNKNVVSIYIACSEEESIKRAEEVYGIKENTKSVVRKTNKKRASYYNYYTSKNWKEAENYDIAVNTSDIGTDKAVDIIIEYLILVGMLKK